MATEEQMVLRDRIERQFEQMLAAYRTQQVEGHTVYVQLRDGKVLTIAEYCDRISSLYRQTLHRYTLIGNALSVDIIEYLLSADLGSADLGSTPATTVAAPAAQPETIKVGGTNPVAVPRNDFDKAALVLCRDTPCKLTNVARPQPSDEMYDVTSRLLRILTGADAADVLLVQVVRAPATETAPPSTKKRAVAWRPNAPGTNILIGMVSGEDKPRFILRRIGGNTWRAFDHVQHVGYEGTEAEARAWCDEQV